jgi:hypothetical protein
VIGWDDVVWIMEMRRAQDAPLLQQMLEVQRRYNGDIAIPLPDMDTNPVLPALTPSLMAGTIDAYAIRAASVRPRVECPPIEPMKDRGTKSIEYARIRQKTIYATWHKNRLPLGLRRMYRHISGYATAVLVVVPDYMNGYPAIEVRNPLGAYPEPRAAEDMAPVANCGFVYERSAEHLRAKYPEARRENGGVIGQPGTDPELWDVIEWLDADQTIIGILGPRDMGSQSYQDSRKLGVAPSQMLRQWTNLSGRCPVVTMPRITLDRVASQVAHQLGNIDLQAKMLALAIVAEERAIFPDRFVIGKDGQAPRIISNGGQWQDGRTGATNLLEGVQVVNQLDSAPPPSTGQTMDRLERNYHVSVGDNPTFGGETYGSLRTGRGIDSMIGAQVDPRVQEMQEIVEYGMSHANELVLQTWKSCFGHKKHVLFSGWGGVTDTFELDPMRHIENTDNVVAYSVAGADVQSTTIILGQLLGTKTISQRTFRDRHPYVEDAEAEEMQLDVEDLKAAAFAAIQQQVASGQMPKMAITWLYEEMKTGKNIFEAQSAVDAKMQALQAQQAPPPEPPGPGEPAMAGAPGAMPGLEGGAQQQPPMSPDAAIGPAPGSVGVRQLVKALGEKPTPQ